MGASLIMGRRTYESIGRPLDGRQNIMMSRTANLDHPGVHIAHSAQEALAFAGSTPIFVIGGAEIYSRFLPIADRLALTLVGVSPPADAYFPVIPLDEWSCEEHREGGGPLPHSYHSLRRRQGASPLTGAGCVAALGA